MQRPGKSYDKYEGPGYWYQDGMSGFRQKRDFVDGYRGNGSHPLPYARIRHDIDITTGRVDSVPLSPSYRVPDRVVNSALDDLYDRGKSFTGFFEDIVEMRNTLRTVGASLVHVANAKRMQGLLTNWREYPTGWLIFNFVIKSAISLIDRQLTEVQKDIKPFHIEATRSYSFVFKQSSFMAESEFTVSGNIKLGATCTPKIVDKWKARWTDRGFVYNVWQIVPYSWLVDYFIDVSSYSRNLENYEGQYTLNKQYAVYASDCTLTGVYSGGSAVPFTGGARYFFFFRETKWPAFRLATRLPGIHGWSLVLSLLATKVLRNSRENKVATIYDRPTGVYWDLEKMVKTYRR